MDISEPIPPELPTLSSTSSFKDVIMQRLQLAQELKQTRTFSPQVSRAIIQKPEISKAPRTPLAPNHNWEQERKLLLDMLEKAQGLVKDAQFSANNEKANFQAEIERLNTELAQLTQENTELRAEKIDFRGSARNETDHRLVRELERLEKAGASREVQHQQELSQYKQELTSALNKLGELERTASLKLNQGAEGLDTFELAKEINKALESSALQQEHKKLQKKLGNLMTISCEREAELTEELERLSRNNQYLTEVSITREKAFNENLSQLSTGNTKLQESNLLLKQRVLELHDTVEAQHEEVIQLFEVLSKRYEEGNGSRTFSLLNGELSKLSDLLLEKESEIETLKFMKKPQYETTEVFSVKEDLAALREEVNTLNSVLSQFEDSHKEEEANQLREIQDLTQETTSLRELLNSYSAKNYENELSTLRTDLQKALAETQHAKRLIIFYIRSIQQLEYEIKLTQNPETIRLQLEIARSHEENRGLLESRKDQEKFYAVELKNLQEVIDSQNLRIKDLNTKLEMLRKNRTKDLSSDAGAAQQKIQALTQANHTLQGQLNYLDSGKIAETYERNIEKLKRQLDENKTALGGLRGKWVTEKQSLKKEISDLKGLLKNSDWDYNSATSLVTAYRESLGSLANTKQRLNEIIQSGSSDLTGCSTLREDFISRNEQYLKESSALIHMLKKDLAGRSLLNSSD